MKVYETDYNQNAETNPDESDDSMDYWAQSPTITNLKEDTFTDFIQGKDAVLVMFYDPLKPSSKFGKEQMDMAAVFTSRDNHGFAGVNCRSQCELCGMDKVGPMPYFKLFSGGVLVTKVTDYVGFTHHQMRKFVENAPTMEEPFIKACKT